MTTEGTSVTEILFPSFPRRSPCVFLATTSGTLGTVPTTLWGVFETNTPHVELENELSAGIRQDRSGHYPLIEAVFVVATNHLRAAIDKPGAIIEEIQNLPFRTRASDRNNTSSCPLRYRRLPHPQHLRRLRQKASAYEA